MEGEEKKKIPRLALNAGVYGGLIARQKARLRHNLENNSESRRILSGAPRRRRKFKASSPAPMIPRDQNMKMSMTIDSEGNRARVFINEEYLVNPHVWRKAL